MRSYAEKKRVKMLVGPRPELTSQQFGRFSDALRKKARRLEADYALGVTGNWRGGFRFGFRTAGTRDGGPAWKLPGADGKFLPMKP